MCQLMCQPRLGYDCCCSGLWFRCCLCRHGSPVGSNQGKGKNSKNNRGYHTNGGSPCLWWLSCGRAGGRRLGSTKGQGTRDLGERHTLGPRLALVVSRGGVAVATAPPTHIRLEKKLPVATNLQAKTTEYTGSLSLSFLLSCLLARLLAGGLGACFLPPTSCLSVLPPFWGRIPHSPPLSRERRSSRLSPSLSPGCRGWSKPPGKLPTRTF